MLQALRTEIIVRPIYEEISRGGIIIPVGAKQFKQYHGSIKGEVISVGPKSEFRNELKPGDKIVWMRHEGKKIIFEGQVYFAVRDKWIRGRVEE